MRIFVLILILIFGSVNALATNHFQEFNGTYFVDGEECFLPRDPDGKCASMFSADQVTITGDSSSGLVDIRNAHGAFTKIQVTEKSVRRAFEGTLTTSWFKTEKGYLQHSLTYFAYTRKYISSSISIERSAGGYRIFFSRENRPQIYPPVDEEPWFALNLEKAN